MTVHTVASLPRLLKAISTVVLCVCVCVCAGGCATESIHVAKQCFMHETVLSPLYSNVLETQEIASDSGGNTLLYKVLINI